jgi:hypothetical protein
MAATSRVKPVLPGAEPGLITLPALTVAVVHTDDVPGAVGPDVMKALYGAAYGLKFALKKRGVEMTVGYPRGRWQWAAGAGMGDALQGDWALPLPEGTVVADLVQKSERFPVGVDTWEYGECAWVMHFGPFADEPPTVARLMAFIEDSGLKVSGRHEEWYLSRPGAKVMKTVILYPVEPA